MLLLIFFVIILVIVDHFTQSMTNNLFPFIFKVLIVRSFIRSFICFKSVYQHFLYISIKTFLLFYIFFFIEMRILHIFSIEIFAYLIVDMFHAFDYGLSPPLCLSFALFFFSTFSFESLIASCEQIEHTITH